MSYVSRRELRKAYEDCIRTKRTTTNAINFEVDENEKLESLYKELNTMTYTIGNSIVFALREENTNLPKREVFAADFRDRIVQHLLINRLINSFDNYHFINDCYACRVEKGTLYGAKRCQEQIIEATNNGKEQEMYILKGDFHNCFNTFNKEKMYKSIEDFVIKYFSKDRNQMFNLWLLKMVIYHCPQHKGNYTLVQSKKVLEKLKKEKSLLHCDDLHGIAIGNLTSQTFANFFLTLFDKYVKEVLGYNFYGRYIDDFFIIHQDKNKLLQDYKKILEFVKTLDLEINTNKLYFQHYRKGVPFVGYFVYYNKLYILNSTKYRFYRTVYDIEKVVKIRFGENKRISKITAERIQSSWNSYMGIISHTNSQCVIKRIFKMHPWLIRKMREVFTFDNQHFYIKIKDEIKKEEK